MLGLYLSTKKMMQKKSCLTSDNAKKFHPTSDNVPTLNIDNAKNRAWS
jgi:hypothetical protein